MKSPNNYNYIPIPKSFCFQSLEHILIALLAPTDPPIYGASSLTFLQDDGKK